MSGRILIVDDLATNRMLLRLHLARAFYDVVEATDAESALRIAREAPPDLTLIDVILPGVNGYELCRRFKDDPRTTHIPVVMITALGAQTDRVAALEAGADDFLSKPINTTALFARIRALLRMKAMTDELRLREETMRELSITPPEAADDMVENARVYGLTAAEDGEALRGLVPPGMDFTLVTDAHEALRAATARPPEAMLIDSRGLPDDSPDFITALRARPEIRGAALLSIVEDDAEFVKAAAALDAGANDYLMRPLDASELGARLRTQLRRKAYQDRLRATVNDGLKLAVTDALTGLRNRRYLDAHLARMMHAARHGEEPLCVLMFDLDRFKAVNDTRGHNAGDMVLQQFAKRLLHNTRSVDLVARSGGEEFVVVMPDADLRDARTAAERVRQAVEKPSFDVGRGEALRMTVSVGVAAMLRAGDDPTALLERADAALYQSKELGRNRVTLSAA